MSCSFLPFVEVEKSKQRQLLTETAVVNGGWLAMGRQAGGGGGGRGGEMRKKMSTIPYMLVALACKTLH
jgi:hypothetical protein